MKVGVLYSSFLSSKDVMTTTVLILLVLFQLKHFLADYPLQFQWMLKKGSNLRSEWIPALLAHSYFHGAGTYSIFFIAYLLHLPGMEKITALMAMGAALFDFCVHFIVDRIKASKQLGGRWSPDKPYFWWALGADQMAHHLTYIYILYKLLGQ